MSDEFERVERLRARFSQFTTPAVELGIGDDGAVLRSTSSRQVLSVDTAVDGVHFRREFAAWDVIGARAFTAAISDLAAMGALPSAALSSLIVPRDLPLEDFDALNEGIARAAVEYGCPVVGGNLAAGRELSITTTVIGASDGVGLCRSGARAGDRIFVTGRLGSAALGLLLLQLGAAERGPNFVAAWREPHARIALGRALLGRASAAIDISDGALQDLGHLAAASGLGAEIDAPRLPLAPGFAELARALGREAWELALCGGEDYELVYTLPQGVEDPAAGTQIGRMLAEPRRLRVLDAAGREQPLPDQARGYRHFEG